jgi:hypothetical protein
MWGGWALAIASLGCASTAPRIYVNPQADLSLYQKVAVLPFSSLTSQPLAGERVTRVFVTELIIADRFRVVEPPEIRGVLRELDAQPGPDGSYDAEKLRQAAGKVEATGVIRGDVTDYQIQRVGPDEYPVLSFTVEMIDVATGNVVWRASITKRGNPHVPVFGGSSSSTLGRLTQEACVEVIDGLRGKAL